METTHPDAAPARKPRRQRSIPLLKRRARRYRGRRPVLPDAIAVEAVALLDELAECSEAIADGQGRVFLLVTLPTHLFERLCQYGGAVEDMEESIDAEPDVDDEPSLLGRDNDEEEDTCDDEPSVGADQPEEDRSDYEPSLVTVTPGAMTNPGPVHLIDGEESCT